jgi:multiple sugar transport system ATP-binding protein
MGSETFWYLKNAGHSFIARVDSHRRGEAGDTVPLMCKVQKAHYFDATTERTLV